MKKDSRKESGRLEEIEAKDVMEEIARVFESYAPSDTRAMHVILRPATGTPYSPGVGPGVFYIPRTGLR